MYHLVNRAAVWRVWLVVGLTAVSLLTACQGDETEPAQPTNPALASPAETSAATPVAIPTSAPAPTLDPNVPTFYVATDGSDDSGDGSASAPWATITHALDTVADGSLILVRPGLYEGRVRIRGQFANGVTVRSELPYQARLQAAETVLTIFEAQGITIEGFDISHSQDVAEAEIVVQIQDLLGEEPGGAEVTSRITLRNNIIHDSFHNDLLKINNGAAQIYVIGNLFYNQGDSDEHIDINSVTDVVVEGNIFFNDFAASGRTVSDPSSYIVVKDSNGEDDGIVGAQRITISRNIMLHWEGSEGSNFVLLGEDGNEYYEVQTALIENNLFLGDGSYRIRAPFGGKGVSDVVFRHNTIVGDLPAGAFGLRLNVEGANQPNNNIQFYNNIWADPTGTMENFATAPGGETAVFTLQHNLYWNGSQPLPDSGDDIISISNDAEAIIADPLLPNPAGVITPIWLPTENRFANGSTTLEELFVTLVRGYGIPGGAALDAALPGQVAATDILGQPRPADAADMGAYEVQNGETAVNPPAAPQTAVNPPAASSDNGNNDSSEPIATIREDTAAALPPDGAGHIVYTIGNALYRLAVQAGAVPEDITARLDSQASGSENDWISISADGQWLLVATDRFDPECVGWPCVVILPAEGGQATAVRAGGAIIHSEDVAALSPDGSQIVFIQQGTHEQDLWITQREGDSWSAPQEITADSPFTYNNQPSFAPDGQKLVFNCGPVPYVQEGTAVCEVRNDGTYLRVAISPEQNGDATHHVSSPSYAPDGSLLFEANWQGEQLWRLAIDSTLTQVSPQFSNDNSPCVLPDGRIVSLWLGRDGNGSGFHEIKLLSADATAYTMLLTDQDVLDVGFGCGG